MKRSRPMTLDECAIRMTAFLARQPRSGKTRAYMATLPKRKKIVVSPAEYQPAPLPRPYTETLVGVDAGGGHVATFVRKDRRRPKVCGGLGPPGPKETPMSPWACRKSGRFHRAWKSGERLSRTLADTTAQRVLLHIVQDGLCALCGDAMAGAPPSLSLDHVVPRSLGGADGIGNLVLCHGECNGRKTNDIPTGCEMVWLFAVNVKLGAKPDVF